MTCTRDIVCVWLESSWQHPCSAYSGCYPRSNSCSPLTWLRFSHAIQSPSLVIRGNARPFRTGCRFSGTLGARRTPFCREGVTWLSVAACRARGRPRCQQSGRWPKLPWRPQKGPLRTPPSSPLQWISPWLWTAPTATPVTRTRACTVPVEDAATQVV